MAANSTWSWEENKAFEVALGDYWDEVMRQQWHNVASKVPTKTVEELKKQYQLLVDDISAIEAGLVPIPKYNDDDEDILNGTRGTPWTPKEHNLFFMGLEKYGKGDWRSISRNCVITRTPTQVASHAQNYFIRNSDKKNKKRSSIHDIITVDNGKNSSGSSMYGASMYGAPTNSSGSSMYGATNTSSSSMYGATTYEAHINHINPLGAYKHGSMVFGTSTNPSRSSMQGASMSGAPTNSLGTYGPIVYGVPNNPSSSSMHGGLGPQDHMASTVGTMVMMPPGHYSPYVDPILYPMAPPPPPMHDIDQYGPVVYETLGNPSSSSMYGGLALQDHVASAVGTMVMPPGHYSPYVDPVSYPMAPPPPPMYDNDTPWL